MTTWSVLQSLLALVLVAKGFHRAVVMTRETWHVMRFAGVAMATGALGVAFEPVYHEPWPLVLMLAGIAVWQYADRRRVS